MAEKVAKLGVAREKDFMYYVKDGAVWKVQRKQPGVPKGRPEKVADGGFQMDTNYIYFVDRDGDVARAKRAIGGQKRKKTGARRQAPRAPRKKAPAKKARKSSKKSAEQAKKAPRRRSPRRKRDAASSRSIPSPPELSLRFTVSRGRVGAPTRPLRFWAVSSSRCFDARSLVARPCSAPARAASTPAAVGAGSVIGCAPFSSAAPSGACVASRARRRCRSEQRLLRRAAVRQLLGHEAESVQDPGEPDQRHHAHPHVLLVEPGRHLQPAPDAGLGQKARRCPVDEAGRRRDREQHRAGLFPLVVEQRDHDQERVVVTGELDADGDQRRAERARDPGLCAAHREPEQGREARAPRSRTGTCARGTCAAWRASTAPTDRRADRSS